MSDVLGVNKTKAATPTPANRLKPGEFDGRVKTLQDTYEADTLAIGSTIKMGPVLPKGAIVLDVELMADALGGTHTLAVGDAEDPDRYITATIMNTNNLILHTNAIAGKNYEVDKSDSASLDDQITILTAGNTITGTIKCTVKYVHD